MSDSRRRVPCQQSEARPRKIQVAARVDLLVELQYVHTDLTDLTDLAHGIGDDRAVRAIGRVLDSLERETNVLIREERRKR